jgi:hypothetical protein
MTLSDILTQLKFPYIVDKRADMSIYSSEPITTVEIIEAPTATDALIISLEKSETPLAVLTASGRFYIYRSGIDGTIIVQGPELNENQQSKLAILAEFYHTDLGRTIDGYFTPPVKKAKASKKSDSVEELSDDVPSTDLPADDVIDNTEPTE